MVVAQDLLPLCVDAYLLRKGAVKHERLVLRILSLKTSRIAVTLCGGLGEAPRPGRGSWGASARVRKVTRARLQLRWLA